MPQSSNDNHFQRKNDDNDRDGLAQDEDDEGWFTPIESKRLS